MVELHELVENTIKESKTSYEEGKKALNKEYAYENT